MGTLGLFVGVLVGLWLGQHVWWWGVLAFLVLVTVGMLLEAEGY